MAAYDGRAMAAQVKATTSSTRLQTAVVVVVSSALLAGAIVATVAFGLGVRTSYGPGIEPALGDQVTRDFLADQDAEAAAVSKSDQSLLNNRLSDSALVDVIQQIQSHAGGDLSTVSFRPTSITVLRAQDPNNLSLQIEVQEDGVKTVTRRSDPDAVPTQDEDGFHGDFWLRLSGGHYLIADQNIQTEAASVLPRVALAVVALIWVALAYLLYRRNKPRTALAAPAAGSAEATPLEAPTVFEVADEPEPQRKTTIRSFGGLQVIEEGKDWAPTLSGRQVMAFFWRRVFLAAVESDSASVARDLLARQLNPTVDRETQLRRLRGLISEGVRELPVPLSKRIVATPTVVRFDFDDCSVDALDLVRVGAELGRLKVLSTTQASRARRLVDATTGTFMPEFETVEDVVTDHHPTCTELIQQLRTKLSDRRVELVAVLARTYIAGKRADMAVDLLEATRQGLSGRPQLVEVLAEAYRATGRESDARALVEVLR